MICSAVLCKILWFYLQRNGVIRCLERLCKVRISYNSVGDVMSDERRH